MQQLQVPTWLGVVLVLAAPIGTAFGAIFGQWLGQKTAAKRDDARWEREREREDLRWQREREREEEKFAHESRLQWLEHRRSEYSDLTVELDDYAAVILDCINEIEKSGELQNPELPKKIKLQEGRFSNAVSRADLVSSKTVRAALVDLKQKLASLAAVAQEGQIDWSDDSPAAQMLDAHESLLEEMRKELAIDPGKTDPINDKQ